MKHEFFLGADPELGEQAGLIGRIIHVLNNNGSLDDSSLDLMATLECASEDAAEACCESGERIYAVICESDALDQDEAHEALCYALFEGGTMNGDMRLVSIS